MAQLILPPLKQIDAYGKKVDKKVSKNRESNPELDRLLKKSI